ncbi:MAG: hypothetical protein J3K34DRAFT_526671 [Monoraphidium minutum]|nr:MAG: hypothetical protein J3K34DRAFT_526671 [Monoraphidium minutum]
MTEHPVVDALPPEPAAFPGESEVLCRAPPGVAPRTAYAAQPSGAALPLGGGMSPAVEFETENFQGRIQVVFKRPPGLQAPAAEALLAGKRRQIWVMVQGRVKRPVAFDDLQCGTWYTRPLHLPARFILTPAIEWLARRLGGGLDLKLGGGAPHIAGPLVSGAQLLNVSAAGAEPRAMGDVVEDTRLLLGQGEGDEPLPSHKRRAHFRHAAHRAGRVWSPDHVITLFFYDHSFNYSTFKMAVPPCFHLDMVRVMDGQPVGISLRDRATGEFFFRFEVWHRRMLEHLAARAPQAAAHAHAAAPAAAHPAAACGVASHPLPGAAAAAEVAAAAEAQPQGPPQHVLVAKAGAGAAAAATAAAGAAKAQRVSDSDEGSSDDTTLARDVVITA